MFPFCRPIKKEPDPPAARVYSNSPAFGGDLNDFLSLIAEVNIDVALYGERR